MQKEVYYLRHKLQKGLFPKEQQPKADDMPHMAEFFTRLENFAEIDASILRATRIHKLPKAILRLENIPREEEFTFKSRSTGLLEKWNKMLADSPPAEGTPAGVNGAEAKAGTNGTEKAEAKTTPVEETKDEGKADAEEKTKAGSEEVSLAQRDQTGVVFEAANTVDAEQQGPCNGRDVGVGTSDVPFSRPGSHDRL